MFDRLQTIIALQFTAIVFMLLMLNGLVFIPLDYRDYRNELDENITKDAETIMLLINQSIDDVEEKLSERDHFRTRIFDTNGDVVFAGELYNSQEENLDMEPWTMRYQNDRFSILTFPINFDDNIIGYLQVGEVYHVLLDDLKGKGWLVFLQSLMLALLVYFFGRFFALRTLKPAVAMYKRIDQFSQDASHELKTPLANAMSSLDLALVDHRAHRRIEEAKKNMYQAAEIVDDLLELAKLTRFTLQKEEVDLSQLVKGVAKEFQRQALSRKIHLITNIEDGVSVEADPGYVLMLVSNLVNNALKFSEAGDKVQITLDNETLSIRDKGIGIDHDFLERLFDPFFQADAAHSTEGSGLGLSIVKKIVDAHDWKIDVQSIKGVGTSFTITFA